MKRARPRSTIAKLRERDGVSQKQLADMLGTSIQTISNWERGRVDLTQFLLIIKICEIFKCEAQDLIEYPSSSLDERNLDLGEMRECIGTNNKPDNCGTTSSTCLQEAQSNENSN